MTSEIRKKKVLVIDNFLTNFEDYKDWVCGLDYVDMESQGVKYRDVLLSPLVDRIKRPLEKILEGELHTQLSFLRKYREGYTHPMWIHSDVRFAGIATTFFIRPTKGEGQDDGMIFWEHEWLGELLTEDQGPEYCQAADAQSLDIHKWKPTMVVPFKENRLVVFDARLFHSKQTYSNRGTVDTCRLIEVGFFSEEPFDIPEVRGVN